MSMLSATLALDVRLQARSRLYAIGIVVALMLGSLSRYLVGPDYAGKAAPVLYLAGLGGTTYVFGAAMVLLEKSQGTLLALRTTPLTSSAYVASKVITLAAFAAFEAAIIQAVGFFGAAFHPIPLTFGVVCLGMFYTFVGLGQVAPHDSIFSFLIPGALAVGSVLQLPVLYVLKVGPPAVWYLLPTQGPLLLMLGAFEPLDDWQWAYAIGMSAISLGLGGWWAKRRLSRFIALQKG